MGHEAALFRNSIDYVARLGVLMNSKDESILVGSVTFFYKAFTTKFRFMIDLAYPWDYGLGSVGSKKQYFQRFQKNNARSNPHTHFFFWM
jgi:hypothetical protein